jgi:DHA2 family methylenomycin A resistance protein-like MFS transporter
VEHAEAGTASGVLNTARQAGGAIGVALFGALVGNDRARIIGGLHGSSLISAALLITAAALAWFGIHQAGVHRRDA